MSNNPVNKAWAWSTEHSPLLNTWRWLNNHMYRQTLARRVISEAGLPTPIADRIDRIVGHTRLWPRERAEIAHELCAHAQDALEQGQSTDDTIQALGDPAIVAKLLRRAAKRKRHWLWQIRRRTSQAILSTIAILFLLYAALFIRFNTGSPRIEHHPIAQLNDRNAGYSEDQRALPAMEALWIEWSKERNRIHLLEEADRAANRDNPDHQVRVWALDSHSRATPDQAGYDEFRAFIERIRPELDAAERASRLPTIGGVYSDDSEIVEVPGTGVYLDRPIPVSADPKDHGSMIGVLLPWLGQTRTVARLLMTDAVFSFETGDSERAAGRIEATLRYAALSTQDEFIISQLVGVAIQAYVEDELLRMIAAAPDRFTDEQLVRLSHLLSSTADTTQHVSMAAERAMFEDVLQRAFTDDGHGDGRLTAKGFEELAAEIFSPLDDSTYSALELNASQPPRASARFVGPVSLLMVASRAEHQRLYDELISIIEPAINPTTPTHEAIARTYEFDDRFMKRAHDSQRYPLLDVLVPALEKTAQTVHAARGHTRGTLLTIAAHLHHRRTGSWPTDANQLVPAMLPARPLDPFDPGQSLRLHVADNQLIVYSVGPDGEDDRGVPIPDIRARNELTKRYPRPGHTPDDIPQGDWVIYPPTDD